MHLAKLWLALICAGSLFAQQSSQNPAIPSQQDSIVVTGTYQPVPLSESDRVVEVFHVNQNSILFDSFSDYLRQDSSVDLQQRAPDTVQSDISIRGGTYGQTLVLLNGIRINDAQSAHHNMDLPVPLEAISEIQILNGSGASQYGSDAVGGVVNLITRASETPEVRLRTALGNWGRNEEAGSIAGGTKNISEELAFSREFSSGFQTDRDYRVLSLASITHAKTALGNTDVLLSLSDRPFGADQFYGDFNSWERTKGWFASIRQELGSNTDLEFAFRRHTDLFVLLRDDPEYFTNRHALESWEGAARRTDNLPGHAQLHYGIEAFSDNIVSNNLGNHSRVYEAGYVSYDIFALRRFSFSAGLRDEIYGSFNSQWSPVVSGGAWLSPNWKLRGSVSRAFRLPDYTDLYYHDPANVGSPNLKPERAWNYEGGIDWHAGQRLHASATAFQRRDYDLIDYVQNSPTDIFRATNFQDLVFTGVEAMFGYQGRRQDLSVQYTGITGERAIKPGEISKYVFNYPINNAVIAWQGSFGSQLAARMRIGATDRYARDPYGIWDASVARIRGHVRPFLQITNITSTVYQEISGVAMPKFGILGGVEFVARMH